MCRMFLSRSSVPLDGRPLLTAPSCSLAEQGRSDRRGESHGDGWGIGHYHNGKPVVVKRPTAAWTDPAFADAATGVRSTTILGHVRQASVGSVSEENTHPFTWGPWLFAHNGTIADVERVLPSNIWEIPPLLSFSRSGQTDSELLFLWLLGRWQTAFADAHDSCGNLGALRRVIAEAIVEVAGIAGLDEEGKPSKLNICMTDGQVAVAVRWGHTLHWLEGPIEGDSGGGRRVIVASEPLGEGDWAELPDRSMLSIDGDLRVEIEPLAAPREAAL